MKFKNFGIIIIISFFFYAFSLVSVVFYVKVEDWFYMPLSKIDVIFNPDCVFLTRRSAVEGLIDTGKIDEYSDIRLGILSWSGLIFFDRRLSGSNLINEDFLDLVGENCTT